MFRRYLLERLRELYTKTPHELINNPTIHGLNCADGSDGFFSEVRVSTVS